MSARFSPREQRGVDTGTRRLVPGAAMTRKAYWAWTRHSPMPTGKCLRKGLMQRFAAWRDGRTKGIDAVVSSVSEPSLGGTCVRSRWKPRIWRESGRWRTSTPASAPSARPTIRRSRSPIARRSGPSADASSARDTPTTRFWAKKRARRHGSAPYRWIVDPIDGTKSFVAGVPLYGVLIGVEVHGEPSVGSDLSARARRYDRRRERAGLQRGTGAPCRVSEVDSLARGDRGYVEHRALRGALGCVGTTFVAATYLQRTWGDAFGYALIATGRAEVMLDPAMHPWDCAPMLPIMREAGGRFADWTGKPTIHGPDAFATNAALYDRGVWRFSPASARRPPRERQSGARAYLAPLAIGFRYPIFALLAACTLTLAEFGRLILTRRRASSTSAT